ncbi:RDD family protein [Streptomyces sp. NPDC047085]|uniref:RDD family protein n=1 Tax=Streptomyces sp. NPDC047085 TaxID=3155140 RepID=UPI0033C12818
MSELVTGEAVALELRPAKLPSRALAVLLDLVVAMILYIGVTMALVAGTASLDEAARLALSVATFLLVLVGAPIAVETLSHGRSLGKLAFGLRVVRDDGGPIRFRHALVRGAIGFVEILMTFGVVACIASFVSARGRRLGDVFAGTLVVRERVPAGRTGFAPPPPPWLAGRFAGLDLSAVPNGLWLGVRQYLTRMHQLDPQVSLGMAQQLAADLAARTGTAVPQGEHPAAFLAAVVQERQAREARQAFGGAVSPVPQPPVAHPGQHPYQPQAAWPPKGSQSVRPVPPVPYVQPPVAAEPEAPVPPAAGPGTGTGSASGPDAGSTGSGSTGFVPPA